MPWSVDDISGIEVEAEISEGDILTIRVHTPADEIWIIGEVEFDGRSLIARIKSSAVAREDMSS